MAGTNTWCLSEGGVHLIGVSIKRELTIHINMYYTLKLEITFST